MRRAFGWTSERTLVSGTSDAADAIGLSGTAGRLAPGLSADFVVVRGRPWDDARSGCTEENIVAVVARGQLVSGTLPG